MTALDEKKAIDALVRLLLDRPLEKAGEPVSAITTAAAEKGIFPTSVEAYGAIEILTALGFVQTTFGIVVPGPHYAVMKARRVAARPVV